MQVGQIAFLLRRGPSLIQKYLDILAECRDDRNMAYHLDELLRIGSCGGEKKTRMANSTGIGQFSERYWLVRCAIREQM